MDSLEFVNDLKDTLITYTCERGTFDTTIYHYHTKEMEQLEKDLIELQKYKQLEKEIGCPLEVFVRLVKEPYIFVKKAYNWANDKEYEINAERHIRLECDEIYKNKEYNTWCIGFEQMVGQPPFRETGLFLVKLSDYKVNWCFEEERSNYGL